jgi:hypothetical protein
MTRLLAAAALAAASLALAACASAPAEGGSAAAAPAAGASLVRLGEDVRLGGLGVRALRLVEDSRCPAGVQCIQAGTVRLAVRITERGSARELVLQLGEPQPLGDGRVLSLASVCPPTTSPGVKLPEASYRFYLAAYAPGLVPVPAFCRPA